MLFKIAFTFMLLAFATAEKADHDKENVYSYEGYIAVGTTEPVDYYSYNMIKADLHVLKLKNGEYWMHMKDVKFIAFSGEKELDDDDDETEWEPIPEASQSITLPFVYHRYANSTMKGISTSNDDRPWSVSMKQAIANLFYHDPRANEEVSQTFHSDVDAFHYFVLTSEKNVHVTKVTSGDMFHLYAGETNDEIVTDEHFPLPMFKKISYDYGTSSGRRLNKIIAINSFEYSPLDGASEKFYVSVNQTLVLKDHEAASDLNELDKEHFTYSETDFESDTYLTETGALDLSKGRIDFNLDTIVEELKKDIVRTFDYLHKSHITLKKTRIDEREHLDSVIRRLKHLDLKHLKEVYESFADKKDLSELLVEIISLTGTPASAFFIVGMVYDKKLEGQTAIDALGNLPIHASAFPNELIDKLHELFDKTKSDAIENQILLTMSNLMSRTKNKSDLDFKEIVPAFIKKLKDAETEKHQLIYMYFLRNIKFDLTKQELIKIARGTEGYSNLTPHVRAESLYGFGKSEEEENALWLLFANKKEDFEIRAAAMNVLVTADQPHHIEKMFWMLTDENDDDELNHLFYTKLDELSDTEIPHHEKGSIRASELLPFFEHPHESFLKSSTHVFESFENGVGSGFEITYYGDFFTHNFTCLRIKVVSKSSGPAYANDEYHVYVKNVGADSKGDLFSKIDEFGVDVATIKNGRILTFYTYTLEDLFEMLTSDKSKLSMYMMEQDHSDEIFIPTDMGVPVVFRNNDGYIAKLETRFEKDTHGKAVFDLVYRGSEIYGFTTYNPVSNSWAGVRRVMTSDIRLPFDLDYKINIDQKILKAVLNKNEEPFGFQSFVYSEVYVKDSNDGAVLKKTCPKCKLNNFITYDEGLEGHVFLEGDNEDSGHYYKLAVYDCQQRVTASYLDVGNYDELLGLITASSEPGMCGVGFMVKNSDKYPATQLELTLRENHSDKPDSKDEMAYKLSYNIKNSDKLLKSWNVNFLFARSSNVLVNWKLSAVSSKENTPNFKFCWEGGDKWTRNQYISHFVMNAGSDESDEKCPKGGSTIKMNVVGYMSDEMKAKNDPEEIFTNCDNKQSKSFHDCLGEVSSYRTYDYDFTYDNLSEGEVDFWWKVSDYFRSNYGNEFIRERASKSIPENALKMSVHYPIGYESVNVSVKSHNEAYRYDDVVIDDYYDFYYVTPYSAFAYEQDFSTEYCEAGAEYVSDDPDGDNEELTYEDGWATLATSESKGNHSYEIKIKRADKKSEDLILHVRNDKDEVELSFKKDFEFQFNGTPEDLKPNVMSHSHDSFDILMTHKDDTNHRVFVNLVGKRVVVEYTHDRVRLSLSGEFTGKCDV